MAMVATTTKAAAGSSPAAYVAKPPRPPPGFHHKTTAAAYDYSSYNIGHAAATTTTSAGHDDEHQALDGLALALRAAAALLAFVAVALVASCRHGDWMEFARYQEYRYLLGASVVACIYSAAQALRNFRRMRAGRSSGGLLLLDFAGDQVVAYLLITASSAALPITIRMRSAVVNIFTDAMVAAISLAFAAFAALALSAMLSALIRRRRSAAQPYY
ncbi:CASP-like protein 4B1 [Dichanthelium oligosanthes]|uniref:CASP-like protein n=1 Tax=Dichanthelium oligosanthes TaxID=888268 RepID=A0A1E5UR52_9POAL|nr:CASP-like protein 4B1 [Dichanthelium oligosanthes]